MLSLEVSNLKLFHALAAWITVTVPCYLDTIGGTAYSNAYYGSGSGPIYLTDVACTSSKTSLLQCNSDPILSGSCTHSEDAGVKCEGTYLKGFTISEQY